MDFNDLKTKILNLYSVFFKDMNIDKQTGIIDGTNKRFSGYPYIGANYLKSPLKILFISLDTGIDECFKDNAYHSLESRENIFINSDFYDFNPHISGMYATALYLLKNSLGLQSSWDALWENKYYKMKKAIRQSSDSLPTDLLTYICYENRFRFVTIRRGWNENCERIKERGGGKDRVWINAEREKKLLNDEIEVLSPDIIVFEGTTGLWNCNVDYLKSRYDTIVTYHPSCYQRKADKLQYIVDTIDSQLYNRHKE